MTRKLPRTGVSLAGNQISLRNFTGRLQDSGSADNYDKSGEFYGYVTVERSRGFDLIERNNPCGERGGSVNEKVADEIRGNLRRSSVGGSLNKISFKREISRDKHYMRVCVCI